MTIGLATRGYLGGGGAVPAPSPCGPGPQIVTSDELVPQISGAKTIQQKGPIIVSGKEE